MVMDSPATLTLTLQQQKKVEHYFPFMEREVGHLWSQWRKSFSLDDLQSMGNEVLCKVFLSIPVTFCPATEKSYIRTSLRRAVLDMVRKKQTERTIGDPLVEEHYDGMPTTALDTFPSPTPRFPEELWEEVRTVLQTLPDDQQRAIFSRYDLREDRPERKTSYADSCSRNQAIETLRRTLQERGWIAEGKEAPCSCR